MDDEDSRAFSASDDQAGAFLAHFLAPVLPQDLQQLLDLDRLHKEISLAARLIKSMHLDSRPKTKCCPATLLRHT